MAREMLMMVMTMITAERRALLELWLVGECRSTRERLRQVPSLPFVSTLQMTWWKHPEDNPFFRSMLIILIRNRKTNTSEGRWFRNRRRNKGETATYWTYKRSPTTGRGDPRGSGWVKAPDFLDVRHYEVGRSSALSTGRVYLTRNPWY